MLLLGAPQIDSDLAFDDGIRFAQEVLQHHVFGRDRRVGLEIEREVPVLALLPAQRGRGTIDGEIEILDDRSRNGT